MTQEYRLFGADTSPYSLKVRSYLSYKSVPFSFVSRNVANEEEFTKLSRSAAMPLLVSPEGAVSQDSSFILRMVEANKPTPYATPKDPRCQFLSEVLEDYADEWLNKAMFHYRWSRASDAKPASARHAEQLFGGAPVENAAAIEKQIAKSMASRLKTIGSTKKNGEVIEASFERFVTLLNAHLEHHLFIFGGHPAMADFALAGQLIQMMSDPTPGAFIREKAPFVTAWCEFMEDPRSGDPFESFETLEDTLLPLIRDEVAVTWLPWALANREALAKKRKTVAPMLAGKEYKQSAQSHSAATFAYITEGANAMMRHDGGPDLLAKTGLSDMADLVEAGPVAENQTVGNKADPSVASQTPPETGGDHSVSEATLPTVENQDEAAQEAPVAETDTGEDAPKS